MNSHSAHSLLAMSTLRACLTRRGGIDLLEEDSRLLRLVNQEQTAGHDHDDDERDKAKRNNCHVQQQEYAGFPFHFFHRADKRKQELAQVIKNNDGGDGRQERLRAG